MFNADCHVGVMYLITCKPIILLHATLYCIFCVFVCTVGLRIYNLLITYDDDDQGWRPSKSYSHLHVGEGWKQTDTSFPIVLHTRVVGLESERNALFLVLAPLKELKLY